MSQPTAIILAAGANSRFFPFNSHLHKSAVELCGEPLILRTLRGLVGKVDQAVVVRSDDEHGQNLEQMITSQRQSLSGLTIDFVTQAEPKGMGDAVLKVSDKVTDKMLVLFPVSYDVGEVFDQLQSTQGDGGSLAASETSTPWLYGMLSLDGQRCISIVEKPERGSEPSNLKAHGIYLLDKSFLEVLSSEPEAEYNFESALAKFFEQKSVNAVTVPDTPSLKFAWHLFELRDNLLAKMTSYTAPEAVVAETAVIDDSRGPVVIHQGAKIGHAAKIVGPCFVGENSLIGDFSFVRGSSVERNAVVGAYTEVVRSVVFRDSTLHQGYLADSILGAGANIGAGLITANKRHDRQPVEVMIKGELVNSSLVGLGALFGDGAKVGVRVTTMPGVAIGANSVIYPSLTLYRNVEHGEEKK